MIHPFKHGSQRKSMNSISAIVYRKKSRRMSRMYEFALVCFNFSERIISTGYEFQKFIRFHFQKIQLFTDGWFLEAMDQYLELRLSHKKRAPTYVYLFTHKAAASFTEIFKGGRENYWGKYIGILTFFPFKL